MTDKELIAVLRNDAEINPSAGYPSLRFRNLRNLRNPSRTQRRGGVE